MYYHLPYFVVELRMMELPTDLNVCWWYMVYLGVPTPGWKHLQV